MTTPSNRTVTFGGKSYGFSTEYRRGNLPNITPTTPPSATRTNTAPTATTTRTNQPTPTRTRTATATVMRTTTSTSAPTATSTETIGSYPAWAPNTSYATGAKVSYGGKHYEGLQGHTSQVGWEPPATQARWKEIP